MSLAASFVENNFRTTKRIDRNRWKIDTLKWNLIPPIKVGTQSGRVSLVVKKTNRCPHLPEKDVLKNVHVGSIISFALSVKKCA